MEQVTMKKAPARLPELTKRCCYGGESFLLTNSGKPVAILSPVGGPENHETLNDTARPSSREDVRLGAGSDGRDSQNVAARSKPNRKRRAAAK